MDAFINCKVRLESKSKERVQLSERHDIARDVISADVEVVKIPLPSISVKSPSHSQRGQVFQE